MTNARRNKFLDLDSQSVTISIDKENDDQQDQSSTPKTCVEGSLSQGPAGSSVSPCEQAQCKFCLGPEDSGVS